MAVKPRRMHFVNLAMKFLPQTRCKRMKIRLLRWAGVNIADTAEIFSPKICGQMTLNIGEHVFIGHDVFIFGPPHSTITIEDYAKLGSQTIVVTGTHRFSIDGDCIEKEGQYADVTICRGAVCSTRTIVLPGKTIGKMSHAAAGSIITHDVPDYVRVAGAPAKIIKYFKEV